MLIVDDFGVNYVGRKHAEHLASVLEKYHEISEVWEGNKFSGIDLIWDYSQKHSGRTCRLSIKIYSKIPVLEKYHEISEVWEGNKFADIDLSWDYSQ